VELPQGTAFHLWHAYYREVPEITEPVAQPAAAEAEEAAAEEPEAAVDAVPVQTKAERAFAEQQVIYMIDVLLSSLLLPPSAYWQPLFS